MRKRGYAAQCPEDLDFYIQMVRLIPADVVLPELNTVISTVSPGLKESFAYVLYSNVFEIALELRDHFGPEDAGPQDDWLKVFEQCTKKLPPMLVSIWLHEALKLDADSVIDIHDVPAYVLVQILAVEYARLFTIRLNLQKIAAFFAATRHHTGFMDNALFLTGTGVRSLGEVAADNRIRIVRDPFLDALEGVDGSRIRECEICRQIFWAKRIDSKTDSPRCMNALKQRRFRQRDPDEYRENRRLVRERKKKGLVKKNGTL